MAKTAPTDAACVVITDLSLADITEEEQIVTAAGGRLIRASCLTEDDVIRAGRDARVLLVQWAPITRRVLEALPRLGLVVRYGVGLDNIDLEAAADLDIAVSHAPDYCVEEVAEHTLALLLALQRRLIAFDADVRAGRWTSAFELQTPARPLAEQTVAIIGFGRIGQRVAGILDRLGASIRVLDPQADDRALARLGIERALTVDDLRGCQVLTLHCPLTADTRGLVDDRLLELLAPDALVVNTARGPLVNADSLVRALGEQRLAGVGLDTFDREPVPADHPLLTFPNVIVTPHVAWLSHSALRKLQRETAREAARFLTGAPLRSQAHKES